MHGLLRRFLAPRWQHPNAEVRRQAIHRLDPALPEQRQALEALCLDAEPAVRQTALARIDSPEQLFELLSQQPQLHEIRSRLIDLLARDSRIELSQRLHFVERLEDRHLLQQVALEADEQQLRLAAVARLQEEADLIEQACDNSIAAVRHAAAARVTSEAGLQHLAQQARRDSQVMRQARERLGQMREAAAAIAAAQAQRETLLHKLEAQAKAPWEPLYGGRFRHLVREWEARGDQPDAEQERRFQAAIQLCRQVISTHEAQAQAESEQRRQQAHAALTEALEQHQASLPRGERLTPQEIDSLRAQKALLTSRWQTLTEQHEPDESLHQRYTNTLADYTPILAAWERYEAHAAEIKSALQAQDRQRLATLVNACQWPDSLPLTELLVRAQQLLTGQVEEKAEDTEARLKQFTQSLTQLESLLDQGASKEASRLHQSLRQRAESLPSTDLNPHRATLKRLGARLAELHDWRGFVAGPKREQLCQAITELAADTSVADAVLDRRHRQLIRDWKALGNAAANRELSEQFRSASDRIHERLADWQQQQGELRERHLEARIALCEQLETLLDTPAEDADPDALRRIRDQARTEWQRHSPVPRDQAKPVGRRFGQALTTLQELIDQRAKEVAEAKRALIDETGKLLERSLSAEARAEQAKQLQQRWRALGRAPRGEEQQLWREFRALCDQIFGLREAQRDDRHQQARKRLDAMQELIDRIDAWQPTQLADQQELERAAEQADALEPLPPGRRTEGMRRRWKGILRARRERLAQLSVQQEVERWQACRPLLEAHLAADAACRQHGVCEEVPLDPALTLTAKMRRAHDQRNAARRDPLPAEEIGEQLARLRAHLSLLTLGRLRQQDEPLRLALQVERLNAGLGRELSRTEELDGVLCDLLATGPVAPEHWEREAVEFDALFSQLAQLSSPRTDERHPS